jgi:hypothetical protein
MMWRRDQAAPGRASRAISAAKSVMKEEAAFI